MNAHTAALLLYRPLPPAEHGRIEPLHSLAVLAAIVLAHAAVFAVIVTSPGSAPPTIAPQPLMVDLIPLAANGTQNRAQPQSPPRNSPQHAVAPKPPQPPPRSKAPAPAPAPARAAAAPHAASTGPSEPAPASTVAGATTSSPSSSSSPPAAPATGTAGERAGESSEVRVTEARFDADYLRNPPPAYPVISRRLGEEGRVVLRVFVDAEGQPTQVDVKTSSSFQRLDQAARQAVSRWRFVPARRANAPIGAWVLVPIVFNLNT